MVSIISWFYGFNSYKNLNYSDFIKFKVAKGIQKCLSFHTQKHIKMKFSETQTFRINYFIP